jgi:uncharacterized peroxidase-related enzyme
MPGVGLIDPTGATGTVKALLDGVDRRLGYLPDLMRVLAHSPAVLRGYLQFSGSLAGSGLGVQLREQIAIAVGATNGCTSCLAAHTQYARAAGLPDSEIDAARDWSSADPTSAAALRFARLVLEAGGGHVRDAALANVRAAGFDDTAIVEIAAVVASNVFTNFINNLAHPAPDVDRQELSG